MMGLYAQYIGTTSTTLVRLSLLKRATTSIRIMETSWVLATTLECVAVSVGYREHPFPKHKSVVKHQFLSRKITFTYKPYVPTNHSQQPYSIPCTLTSPQTRLKCELDDSFGTIQLFNVSGRIVETSRCGTKSWCHSQCYRSTR